jgi:hypothetical protein
MFAEGCLGKTIFLGMCVRARPEHVSHASDASLFLPDRGTHGRSMSLIVLRVCGLREHVWQLALCTDDIHAEFHAHLQDNGARYVIPQL